MLVYTYIYILYYICKYYIRKYVYVHVFSQCFPRLESREQNKWSPCTFKASPHLEKELPLLDVPRLFLPGCVMFGQHLAYLAAPRIWQPERRNETSVPVVSDPKSWHSQWRCHLRTPKVKYCSSLRVVGQMRWPGDLNTELWKLSPT